MIELLLQAENALAVGLLDNAERIYWQAVERDPANAIAIVGLARVALERGDERTALSFARKALEVDPELITARRMIDRLEEVIAYRGDTVPGGIAELPTPGDPGAARDAAATGDLPAPAPDREPGESRPDGDDPAAPEGRPAAGRPEVDAASPTAESRKRNRFGRLPWRS